MGDVTTYAARRRLKIAPGWREPGELVPEAHTWMRRDDWLHTGYLQAVTVSEADFRAAVAQYAPDSAETILERSGVDEGVHLIGPQNSPVRHTARKPTKAPAPLKPAKATKAKS